MMNPDYNDDACTGIVKLGDEYFTVHVYGKEGKKPKFHLLDKENNSVCRIRLDKPKYADKESTKLSDDQAKDLNEYFKEVQSFYKYSNYKPTNWNSLCTGWNAAVENKSFKFNEQPDYTLLNKEKKIMKFYYEDDYLIEAGYDIPGIKQYKQLGNCKLYVYGREGIVPHFHLLDNKGNLICCICLHSQVYFDHGKGYERIK